MANKWLNKLTPQQRKYVKLALWILLILPGIPFVLFPLGFFGYILWPYDVDAVIDVELEPTTQHINLSAHGVKDNPASWSDALQQVMQQYPRNRQASISLDWRPYSENVMLCSTAGKRVGEKLAERLVAETDLISVHAIGHSCGSFVIHGLCQRLKQIKPSVQVHTTYLDPVSVYAGLWWDYGVNHFGNCADFSDAYIDTGDTVPGSNQALVNAHTFDVTAVRIETGSKIAPHNWPTRYYLTAYQQGRVPIVDGAPTQLQQDFPKGMLTRVSTK